MSTTRRASPNGFSPPNGQLTSFDLGGIVDYLKQGPPLFDLHQNNDIFCDPMNVSKDGHQNALSAVTGSFESATHTNNATQQVEAIDPTSISKDWSPESETFFSTGRSDLSPQNLSQDSDISRRSSGFGPNMHWASPMDGLTMDDLDFLCPVDSASPLSGQGISAPKSDRKGANPENRERGPEPVETSRLAWRRAKNRTAASKCRAKQKDRAEALQQKYEESSAQNAYLKRQERVLKGLVISLRDCALQHDSTRCRCKVLHAFNIRRAEQISRSMNC